MLINRREFIKNTGLLSLLVTLPSLSVEAEETNKDSRITNLDNYRLRINYHKDNDYIILFDYENITTDEEKGNNFNHIKFSINGKDFKALFNKDGYYEIFNCLLYNYENKVIRKMTNDEYTLPYILNEDKEINFCFLLNRNLKYREQNIMGHEPIFFRI